MFKIKNLKKLADIMNDKTSTDKKRILSLIETLDIVGGDIVSGCPKCDALKHGIKAIFKKSNEGRYSDD